MVSTLQFPEQYSPCDEPPQMYTMTRTDFPAAKTKFAIGNTKLIHNGNSKVYRARMTREGCGSEFHEVVCKIVHGARGIARLRNEAEMYKRLRKLQCDVVPGCYGLYEGELEDGRSACLVTEYRGESLQKNLSRTDEEFRHRVIKAVVRIHSYGVRHYDICESNIVVGQDGKPFIIDFDYAEKHECHCPKKIIMNATTPFRSEFGCDEIFRLCEWLKVWKPHLVPYLDGFVYVRHLETPEMLATMARGTVPWNEALEKARSTIALYEQAWGKWQMPEYDYLGDTK